MPIDQQSARDCLAAFDFEDLFINILGWDRHTAQQSITVGDETFHLAAVAEKRGMAVFHCASGASRPVPDHPTRRRIELRLTKLVHEHLIIFTDAARTVQVWQWVRREHGKPAACREHRYHKGHRGDPLVQKLQALAVSLEEEEGLTLPAVTGKARKAFDVDRVTKRFYDLFKKEHAAFLAFLKGIPDEEMERWYVSVMLNRLMFIYFIQKKGFLDGDLDYLKKKLAQSRRDLGHNRFYRDFLCPLFFEGFAKKPDERSANARDLLGAVPYLNGGIFMPHQIEQLHGQTIAIPDKAFDQLFTFFDAYHWHLDERPLRADNEINPDVLGYIFEKYINQKQMGAYYTKDDITGYISQNTVIPRLLDMAREKCKVAFEPAPAEGSGASVWQALQEDPDRYIYPAVKHGVIRDDGSTVPESDLPDFVQTGMHDPKARMFDKRYNLGQATADDPLRLPTETWREYVARRERCLDLRGKLAAGEIRAVNDLITYNLDIRQFAQDAVQHCEGPELLVAFWRSIAGCIPDKSNSRMAQGITILDPACGSGAFLFAALNILEPLYDACLERMEFFLEEWGEAGRKNHPNYCKLFSQTLERVPDHRNRRYFILKSIVVNNLYGVDIMEEAVEICKLRLFLKLVAQVEEVAKLPPLPDIDFNIRAGNTLVGFVSLDEVRKTTAALVWGEQQREIARIEEEAELADMAFKEFHRQQTAAAGTVTAADKEALRTRLASLADRLDRYLAGEYGIDAADEPKAFARWRHSHKPFHWFSEFYGIMDAGGFDVVIGNPPYVEYSKVKGEYTVQGYAMEACGNLYAFFAERNTCLFCAYGRTGMIVPHSAICTDRMAPVLRLLCRAAGATWFSTYGIRPAKLFVGVDQRLLIYVTSRSSTSPGTWSSRYHRWHEESRPHLLPLVQYASTGTTGYVNSLPKVEAGTELMLWERAGSRERLGSSFAMHNGATVYFHNAPRYWVRAMDFAPYFWNERDGEQLSTQVKTVLLPTKADAAVAVAALNSSLFYWWFVILSDCRHLNMREIERFPIGLEKMSTAVKSDLAGLTREFMADLKRNKVRKECEYKTTGSVMYDEFYPGHSKPILDRIDCALAKHYGFTDEQLDFIINYDIKYRMGQDADDDDEA